MKMTCPDCGSDMSFENAIITLDTGGVASSDSYTVLSSSAADTNMELGKPTPQNYWCCFQCGYLKIPNP